MALLPSSRWVHVHAELGESVATQFNLLGARGARGEEFRGNLKGCLGEVYLWTRTLAEFERAQVRPPRRPRE